MHSAIIIGGGRMGTLIKAALLADGDFEVLGIYDIDNAGELHEIAPAAEIAFDFSHATALPAVLAYVTRTRAALVSGTTGFSEDDKAAIARLGALAPVVHASNYSLGVAVLKHLAAEAAATLGDFDIEIVEMHHNQKADAPSGTAKLLLEAVDPEGACAVANGRAGMVGARPSREIGMHALRGGTVAGVHEVHFFGADEEVTLAHRATSRQIFVAGAVAAAKRLLGREPGFYTFDDLMF